MPADLTFLHGFETPRCTARVDKRFEGYYTLQFMDAGAVELFYDARRHALEGRWFWPAYPGPRIRFHPAPGHASWHHRYVAFRGPLVRRWLKAGLYPNGPQPAPPRRDYASRFDELLADTRRTDRWGRLRAVNRLEAILIELAEDRGRQAGPPPWLEEVIGALGGGESPADYEALAARMNVALSTLRRRFRDAAGVPLHQYVLRRRITEARRLLNETDEPIKTIADRLGYRDVYFFSRQFRQQVGVPPATYRQSRQG